MDPSGLFGPNVLAELVSTLYRIRGVQRRADLFSRWNYVGTLRLW